MPDSAATAVGRDAGPHRAPPPAPRALNGTVLQPSRAPSWDRRGAGPLAESHGRVYPTGRWSSDMQSALIDAALDRLSRVFYSEADF